jgi:hypothetical protein
MNRNWQNKEKKMKHLRTVTVAKADAWTDISTWFQNLGTQISSFFKGHNA